MSLRSSSRRDVPVAITGTRFAAIPFKSLIVMLVRMRMQLVVAESLTKQTPLAGIMITKHVHEVLYEVWIELEREMERSSSYLRHAYLSCRSSVVTRMVFRRSSRFLRILVKGELTILQVCKIFVELGYIGKASSYFASARAQRVWCQRSDMLIAVSIAHGYSPSQRRSS